MEKKKYVKIPFEEMKELIRKDEYLNILVYNDLFSDWEAFEKICQLTSELAGFSDFNDSLEQLYSDEYIKKTYQAEIIEE